MRTTINSDAYCRSHGKAPRGRGFWIFHHASRVGEWAGDNGGPGATNGFAEFGHSGTYTEACRALRAHAQEHGLRGEWFVLS